MVFALAARHVSQHMRDKGVRFMGSAAGKGVTYEGVTIHPPSTSHIVLSEILGGLMWSWLFIRCYEDGEGLIFGHTGHLDHELHELQHGEGEH